MQNIDGGSQNQYIFSLVREALHDIDNPLISLGAVVRKCIRIATLRQDYLNLLWLQTENIDQTDKEQKRKVPLEISLHLPKEIFEHFRQMYLEMYISERSAHFDGEFENQSGVIVFSVGQIEMMVREANKRADEITTPTGLHPVDLYFVDDANVRIRTVLRTQASECLTVLERIRGRLHDYLSQAEAQLVFGQFHSDIFEENRRYVDLKLGQLCPDALHQFNSAYQRMKENDPESWSQALSSCRRLMKSLADAVYPAKDSPIIGSDGKEHTLTDDLYISRLWQFVFERLKDSRSGELLQAEIQDIGNRLDRLYNMTNKGVHSQVTRFEVNQAIIQTYIVLGDLVRVAG